MRTHPSIRRQLVAACLVASALVAAGAAAQDTGSADFTSYVAIGDSLTAGFMSGGLVSEVQALSYPALIAAQARGSSAGFEQPLVSAPGIPPLLDLVGLAPTAIVPNPGLGLPTNINLPRSYDNLAVPGADVDDVLNTFTDGGGLHDLILRGRGTQLQQALSLQPTFVTVWIGNNDALGAATSGIVIDDVTLTSLANFEAKFRAITGALAASGAGLALATLPSVTSIPFVTALPPVLVDPVTNQPVLIGGQPVPLIGPDGLLTPGQDFVLLTAAAELGVGKGIPVAAGGTGEPLSDSVVLSGAEAATINARVGQFNQVIRAVATETGAALVDVNAVFNEIVAEGLELGGVTYTSDFLTGGLFSYDGVHASATGYAVIANEFLEAINATFGAEIPLVDLHDFVFGPLGSVGTDVGAPVSGFRFTNGAERQLREALGVPRAKVLEELKAQLEGDPDDPAACGLELGERHYCKACGPCAYGEGDCRRDAHCQPGLRCVARAGADFGFRRSFGVCM